MPGRAGCRRVGAGRTSQGWQPLCEDLKEAREELRTSPGRRDQPEQRPREGAAREEEGWTQVRVGTWAERTGRR